MVPGQYDTNFPAVIYRLEKQIDWKPIQSCKDFLVLKDYFPEVLWIPEGDSVSGCLPNHGVAVLDHSLNSH